MLRDRPFAKVIFGATAITIGMAATLPFILFGCSRVIDTKTAVISSDTAASNSDAVVSQPAQLSFIANFYDNYGNQWFSAEGSHFDLSPNKIKDYTYDNLEGDWLTSYTMSSVVSVDIDGNKIESCGSTILFADSRLKQYPIEIPDSVDVSSNSNEASISSPRDIRLQDYWNLNWWWKVKDAYDYEGGAKTIVIQSQQGNPICMYSGDDVTWEVSKNLPTTTELTIDGMKLYIHRANFTILDNTLFY